jgi:hypothetical protein
MRGIPHLSDRGLRRYYQTYNAKFFGGALPEDVDVIWAPHNGCSGVTIFEPNEDIVIKINPMYLGDSCRGRLLLLHEMCHVKLGTRVSHGPKFQAEMLRLAQIGAFKNLW